MDLLPCSILLVEDNPADIELIKATLEQSKLNIKVNVVLDGEEAINYLQRTKTDKDATGPDLILLDINIPKKDGREVLTTIKSDDDFKDTPVIVLTSSSNEDDISYAYSNGANCFITKPIGLVEFTKSISLIEEFWLSMAKLPFESNRK